MKNLKFTFYVLVILVCLQKSYGQENFVTGKVFPQKALNPANKNASENSKKLAEDISLRCIEKNKNSRVEAKLSQVVISDNVLFYKVEIDNRSNISYDLDFVRFYIRDIETAKRTVTQEQEIHPVHQYGVDKQTIAGNTSQVYVFAFRKFTLTNRKAFYIEIYEKNGGRHLYLKAKQPDIAKAITFK